MNHLDVVGRHSKLPATTSNSHIFTGNRGYTSLHQVHVLLLQDDVDVAVHASDTELDPFFNGISQP